MKKKNRRKWKIAGFSILGIILLIVAGLGYEYYKIQPTNHFSTVPVVSSGKTGDTTSTSESVEVKEPVFNLLLIGSDERKGQNVGHSDSMMLVHVDLTKHQYDAISIPRDTRVHLDGYGYTKLTSVQYIMQATKGAQKGVEAAVNAVAELTGTPINYYVETNYGGFQAMVDAVDGIEMSLPFDVKLTHPWYGENKDKVITAGTHSFDGKMVAEVVHERYSLASGEYGRQKLQEEALKGIAKKALSPNNITNLPSLVKSIPDFVIATNMSTQDMLSLGLAAKDFDPNTQLEYHQIPGEGKRMYDDILKANNYQLVINQDKIKDLVAQNF
ncbi:LCP family protein [Bacillus sp. ISL-40]|uniref:LCP family protein n=1 Tax=unclassified Bacillus (in: firmicutes) TaxID=185979 RepID=UPI001BEC1A8B|nr:MULTISPECIES: LCP family protein [unclassified Bacillus (in: firmicutes)]MBT2695921.1 LCP family protein [Bacillus sp. ISL-40]MBT2739723.1 LCP family protein [Bacillus sp. ISL-77]